MEALFAALTEGDVGNAQLAELLGAPGASIDGVLPGWTWNGGLRYGQRGRVRPQGARGPGLHSVTSTDRTPVGGYNLEPVHLQGASQLIKPHFSTRTNGPLNEQAERRTK